MKQTLLVLCCLFLPAVQASTAVGDDWFAPFPSVADYKPKGPTHCFRQFNIDWSWIARREEQLPEFLSQADPAAFAEFCRQTHVDGTIVMAVPHHGYCTYETRIGQKFPGMKGDWFGRTIEELHKRRIAAFGYVTLNWNWRYIRQHQGQNYIHARVAPEGISGNICLNAPGYLEMVEDYTREVLENYPVDGMRWDILQTAEGCLCDGCKQYYRELYGEELTAWDDAPGNRRHDFYLATTGRAVLRLRDLCKRIKPSVEIWQNSLQSYHANYLDLGRDMDIAYNEYGDPFRLLLIRGVTDKPAAINGLMNRAPTDPPVPLDRREWRLCLALGGRCYSYYGHKHTDPKRILPGPSMLAWHRDQLAPFYQMVSEIQPWLIDASPVSHVGVVFSERTRFRYPRYDRKAYVDPMEAITVACLKRSLPLEFVNCLDLASRRKQISRFQLLVIPASSGLDLEQLTALRRYVEEGGKLLVAGDALRHDARGVPQKDFALADEMGVSYVEGLASPSDLRVDGSSPAGALPKTMHLRNVIRVRPVAGKTLLSVTHDGVSCPLLHLNDCGKGTVAWLTSLDCVELTESIIDWLAGPPPLVVDEGKQAILTCQPSQQRWVLHLISDGDYTVEINRAHVPAGRVAAQYPQSHWKWEAQPTEGVLRIQVTGPAEDRLLVLEN